MTKVGALWKAKSKKGTEYLNGKFSVPVQPGQKVLVFAVTKRDNPKSPAYEIFISDDEGGNG